MTNGKQTNSENQEPSDPNDNKIGLISVIGSVLAAIFGIQSDKNRQRDFQQNSATTYVVVGIIMVIGLVITMIIVVNSVISSTAS